MTRKLLTFLLISLASFAASAQKKVFFFDEIYTRNSRQQWVNCVEVLEQSVSFTKNTIEIKVDKKYDLEIVTTTHLPDKGIIYVCKDQQQDSVTVMLLRNKLYLYNHSNRFLIDLKPARPIAVLAESYAEAD